MVPHRCMIFHLVHSAILTWINGKASSNIFDDLDSTCPHKCGELQDELTRYLSSDIEFTADVIQWWHNKSSDYPCLSRMALDYLMIPGVLFLFLVQQPLTI